MHLQKTIENLGYSSTDARTYLASLSLGEATITDIAKQARLPRTTCQASVASLALKGLMNSLVIRRRKYWIAENPQKLLLRLNEKETTLKTLLPELQALRHETGVRPTVQFFRGVDGVNRIFDDIIESHFPILSLTSMDDAIVLLSDDFHDFIERRHKSHLPVKFLTKRSVETMVLKKRDAEELRETRFLPDNFTIKNANFIYGNKVAIISLNKKLPMGIIIEDEGIAATQSELFTALWDRQKDSA